MFIFEEEKILPFSEGRYKLNKFGEILDFNNELIKIEIINNEKVVKLDWINGVKFYEVGVIVVIIFYNIQIPETLWCKIEPIYVDGNKLNTSIVNISYRFKNSPIEVDGLPGFFHIPFYSNYAISLDGRLFNLKKKIIHSWHITKYQEKLRITGGYRISRGMRDFGHGTHVSRHRLIGLTFIRYDTDPRQLVINHKDGIPGNDCPNNLEWCTRSQNFQHAIDTGLMPNSIVKVLMKNIKTGVIESFNSIADCAKRLEKSESFVRVRLYKKQNIRYWDNLVFKIDDETDWPIIEDRIKSEKGVYSLIARNIFTGEILIFDSIEEASRITNTCMQSILKSSRLDQILPVNGFNFRYLTSNLSWPNHSEKHLKIYRVNPSAKQCGIVVKNLDDKEINFFESIEVTAKQYKTSVSTIIRSCNENKEFNGVFFSRYKLTENLGHPIE